jgi:hypothetical protein
VLKHCERFARLAAAGAGREGGGAMLTEDVTPKGQKLCDWEGQ